MKIRQGVRRHSLRKRLILSLLTVALLPVAVLSAFYMFTAYENARKADMLQMRLSERLAADVETYVEMHRRGIEAAAKQMTLSGLKLEPRSKPLQAILESLHEQFPGFINLYIANSEARTLAFYPEFNAAGDSMIGADFSSRWHYAELKKHPQTYISPVMKGVGGTDRLLVTIVAPFHTGDGKPFSGFVLGALDLKKINDIVLKAEMPEGGFAIVADTVGQAIARPDFEYGTHPVAASDGRLLQEVRQKTTGYFINQSTVTGDQVYTTFTKMSSPDWVVAISRPERLRVAELHASITAGVMTIVALFILIGWIASRFASRIAGSLETLSRSAVRFGEGHLEELGKGLIRDDDAAEVRALGDSLERMATDLRKAQGVLLQKNAYLEEGVRHRTAMLDAALGSMEESFMLFDDKQRLLFANAALDRLLGVEASADRMTDVTQLVEGLHDKGFADISLQHFMQPGRREIVERSGGEWWSFRSFPISDADRVIGLAVMLRDVSERVRIEQMKNSLISVVAHEMKAPVAAIRMEVDTLRRRDANWPKDMIDELLGDLDEDTGRLEHLLTDWLDTTRLETGALVLFKSSVNLTAVIEEAVDIVGKSATFDFSLVSPPSVLVDADFGRLRQVFVNLLINSVRYSDRHPSIEVRVVQEAAEAKIFFQDNGIGIAKENWDNIFEKFHQVDMSDTRRQGGTGLGLTICRGILAAHNGSLSVFESRPQEGTTFRLVIPLSASHEV